MKNLASYLLLAFGLWSSQSVNAAITVAGTTSNQNQFLNIVNRNSTGGTWSLNTSNVLTFSGLPTNSFSFLLFSFNEQPSLNITLEVGSRIPGVIFGHFRGGGVQAIDLDDIIVLPNSSSTLFTRSAMLIHEISEVFFSELRNLDFPAAHQEGITQGNSFRNSVSSDMQRRTSGDFDVGFTNGVCNGLCEIHIAITKNGNPSFIKFDVFGSAVLGPGGFFDFGDGSLLDSSTDFVVSSQTLIPGTVKPSDYITAGNIGDRWIYTHIEPPQRPNFNVNQTEVTTGPNIGRRRMGDFAGEDPNGNTIMSFVFEVMDDTILVYEVDEGDEPPIQFTPPLTFPKTAETDQVLSSPYPDNLDTSIYLQTLDKLNIPTGTFSDIVVYITLDELFPPNSANTLFDLDPIQVPYAVTDVDWYSRGIGLVKHMGVKAETGELAQVYELQSTTVPIPRTETSIDFDSLPSSQGWTYSGSLPEEVAFFAEGSSLVQMTVGSGDSNARYQIDGIVNSSKEMRLSFTARVLSYERLTSGSTGLGFNFLIRDDASDYRLGMMDNLLTVNGQSFALDTTVFHDYVFDLHPGGDFELFVDGGLVLSGNGSRLGGSNFIFFGDSTSHENTDAEITALSFEVQSLSPKPITGNFIDFARQANGAPFVGQFDAFDADEYLLLGVVINDSDPSPDSTFVNRVNPINRNTNISGYYVNVGAFASIPITLLDITFTEGSREVAFDYATPDGRVNIKAYGDVGQLIFSADAESDGNNMFINNAGFDLLAGQAVVNAGETISRVVVESTQRQGLIIDNLRFEPAIPASSQVANDVVLGIGVIIGENVTIRRGTMIGDHVQIGDGTTIRRNVVIGNDALIGDNVIIGKKAEIGDRVSIGNNSKVEKNVVVGSDTSIGVNVSIAKNVQIGTNGQVGNDTLVKRNVIIGNDALIGDNIIIGKKTEIGDRVSIGDSLRAAKNVVVGSDTSIGVNVTIAKKVQIGTNVQIGDGTIIRKNIIIGDNAVIGSNVIIERDTHAGTKIQVDWSVSIPDFPGRDPGPGQLSGSLGVFEVNAPGDTFVLPADGTLSVNVSGFSDGFPNGSFAFTRTFSSGPPVLQFLSIGTTPADITVNFIDSNTGLLTDFPAPCTVNGTPGSCIVVLFDNTNTGTDEAVAGLLIDGTTRPSFPINYVFTVLSTE